jgi:hypothetical protein
MDNLEFKGTNTKWESVYNGLYYYITPVGNAQALASTQINEYIGIDQDTMAANANLIAAAPDLLEALQLILSEGEHSISVMTAKKAIQKALSGEL